MKRRKYGSPGWNQERSGQDHQEIGKAGGGKSRPERLQPDPQRVVRCVLHDGSPRGLLGRATLEVLGKTMTRRALLKRYRPYRKVCTALQTAALSHVSAEGLQIIFRQLGLFDRGVLVTGHEEDLVLGFDLALYTAQPWRSQTIDRFAKLQANTSTDTSQMLQALCKSSFSIFRFSRHHDVAGLFLEDTLRGGEIWLMDEGLEASAILGTLVAMRLAQPDDFAISCGVVTPINAGQLEDLADHLARTSLPAEPARLADDQRLPRVVYKMALSTGLTDRISYL